MKKNYFLFVLFVLLSNFSFSQTKTPKTAAAKGSGTTIVASETIPQSTVNTSSAAENKTVFEKKPLPPKQKLSPAIFYVENDKPVDQLKYQQLLQQKSQKK